MPNATPFGVAADPKKLYALRQQMAKKMGSKFHEKAEQSRVKEDFKTKNFHKDHKGRIGMN